ncbi:SHOCT domain-containing protein [Limimaricola variabilis]
MTRLISGLLLSLPASTALADPDGYGHMMGWGSGGFGMIFGPVLWLIVLGLVVAGIIWIARRIDETTPPRQQPGAVAELDMRFARGEIDAEEYASRKKLLST